MSISLDELAREPEPPERPKRQRSERDRERDRSRRQSGPSRSPLEVRLRESVVAISGWVRDRGDDELADVLERDARAMADVLGKVAKLNPVAKQGVSFIADVLEPVRAFGPTLRIMWGRLLTRRAERLEPEYADDFDEDFPAAKITGAGEPEPVEPELAEPWRLPG